MKKLGKKSDIVKNNRNGKLDKKTFTIPEYDVDVEFARDIIQVLDCTTSRLLNKQNMVDKEFLKLENVVRRSFQSFKANSESGKNYLVNLDFVCEHAVLSTNGEYILDISMVHPYHGFYFGLYEIGEFKINDADFTFDVVNTCPYNYIGSGVTSVGKLKQGEKRIIYFGQRETQGDSVKGPHRYYVVKMEWSSERGINHKVVWRKPMPAAVMALVIKNNLLFIGLKNGDVQILDLSKDSTIPNPDDKSEIITYKGARYRVIERTCADSETKETKIERILEEVEYPNGPEVIFNQKLFVSNIVDGNEKDGEVTQIEVLPNSKRIAVVGGARQEHGSVAIFTYDGKLLLNTRLGDSIIKGVCQTASGLFLTNANKIMYQIKSDFTEETKTQSITKVTLDREIMSNIIVIRDWVCGSGAETLSFIFTKDVKKRSSNHLDDTFARCVVGHEFGVISGDDLGKLRFWKVGNIDIHEV